ncbi:hypothetical protein [Pedobacter faecalis]|nr:hypothetical protein [Pedobacter sp. ELA7]
MSRKDTQEKFKDNAGVYNGQSRAFAFANQTAFRLVSDCYQTGISLLKPV